MITASADPSHLPVLIVERASTLLTSTSICCMPHSAFHLITSVTMKPGSDLVALPSSDPEGHCVFVRRLPLVSVVTPSFNAARFLRETIRSVLTQDYPRIEYIVVDGGSTDGTLDILKDHAARLAYVSGQDHGAADALNKGFARARGEILAWLNADDTYLPGAASRAVEALVANPDAAAVYGEGYWIGTSGEVLGRYPTTPCDPAALGRECCICQPACFIRREAMETIGMLNAELKASFDYDLWIRLAKRYRLVQIPEPLATSRMHRENKTLSQRKIVFRESIGLLARHYKYVPLPWVYCYLSFLRDHRDQFFEPLRGSILTYLLTLPMGLRYNHAHPLKYVAEWLAAVKRPNQPRLPSPEGGPE